MRRKKTKYKSNYDPLGSYTGVSIDKGEKPVQDVDDL